MRVHKKIKQPHAPLDGETLSFVARKHGVDGGGDLHRVGRIEKHFDEFFATAIPRVYEREIDVHNVIDSASVRSEKATLVRFVAQNLVQCVSGFFGGHDCQKNAAAKNWIDKSGGVTHEQPAVAEKFCVPIRVIAGGINRRDPLGSFHSLEHHRLFVDVFFKRLFR